MSVSFFTKLKFFPLFFFTTRRILLCLGFLSLILLTAYLRYTDLKEIHEVIRLRDILTLDLRPTNHDPPVSSQRYCCLANDRAHDICGRLNCTWPCPKPEPPIPQLNPDEIDPRDQNNGFFIETSGTGRLNYRQACAAESLAYHNPNITVFILFIDAKINTSSTIAVQLEKKYRNINLVSINIDDYLAGTPLEHWYHCTEWRKGPYWIEHLSDGLRVLTVAKYGGYYFDLDVIQVRPITYMRNFLITNCVIHADYGHPLMQMASDEFPVDYRSDRWTHNGPDLLVRVLQRWCNAKDRGEMTFVKCHGYYMIPVQSFDPVGPGSYGVFFEKRPENETGKIPFVSDHVAGLHTFNKLSKGIPLFKNSTQYFTRLAREHCPFTFSKAPEIF